MDSNASSDSDEVYDEHDPELHSEEISDEEPVASSATAVPIGELLARPKPFLGDGETCSLPHDAQATLTKQYDIDGIEIVGPCTTFASRIGICGVRVFTQPER